MLSQKRVTFVIDAKDNASQALAKLKNETNNLSDAATASTSKFSKFGSAIKDAAKIAATGLVIAGGAATAFATKAAFAAARIEELEFVLEAVAKANDIEIEKAQETVKELRNFNIAHRQALEITNLFMQSQLDLNDAIRLGNVAKDLAVIGSMDSSEATKILIEATAGQSIMMLRQFGIVTTLDDLYEKYGKTIGKTSQELTETEKKQAFLNEIFVAGEKVAGTYDAAMDSVSKRYRSLTGRIIPDFIAQVGKAFTPAMAAMVDEITNEIKIMSEWVEHNQDKIEQWGAEFTEQIVKVINWLKQNEETIIMLGKAVVTMGKLFIGAIGLIINIVGKFQKALETAFYVQFVAIDKAKKYWDDLYEKIKSVIGKVISQWKGLIDFIKKPIDAVVKITQKIKGDKEEGKAVGGQVVSGQSYLVGERGPEMFVPNQSGTILPNEKTSTGNTFNFNFSGATIADKSLLVNEIKQAINRELELSSYGIG